LSYQEQLDKAQELVEKGEHSKAAKMYEDIGTKQLREGGDEQQAKAAKVLGKSIAHYLLAENEFEAKTLAFQVLYLKEKDPFLALQIESAISPNKTLARAFYCSEFLDNITEKQQLLNSIPESKEIFSLEQTVTIKKMWKKNIHDEYIAQYDLLEQSYETVKEMVNYIFSIKTGVIVLGGQLKNGKKVLIQLVKTYNTNPVEVIE
jgi:hypothetical protein